MSDIIDRLRQDHKNMSQLLDLLAREVRLFKDGKTTDFELIESILDYILNYPDLSHHPLEDLVLAKLRARDPKAASGCDELEREHLKLSSLTRRFAAAVHNIIQDEELPRDWFLDVATEYLTFQRRHMQMEEVVFFPPALRSLNEADWAEIADEYSQGADPLFGTFTDEKYQRLHGQIMEWAFLFKEGPKPRARHLQR